MLHPSKRVIWLFLMAFSAPLIIYLCVFGFKLSSDHLRWAEFGSAMSGIYAPIVAVATLSVLLAQVGLQKQMNDHSNDQAHFMQARADIEFYASQMDEKLNQIVLAGKTFRAQLHLNFQPDSVAELDSDSLRMLAANFDSLRPTILGMWSGVYPILTGLATSDGSKYQMTLNSSIQKLIAVLSFETCVALDNYYRARTEGRLSIDYQFSPLLHTTFAS